MDAAEWIADPRRDDTDFYKLPGVSETVNNKR